MFTCPTCQRELHRAKLERTFCWACPQCSGKAITLKALEEYILSEAVSPIWKAARESETKAQRGCPSCQKMMVEIRVAAGEEKFEIDVCKRCQFFWFDPAEYENLPAARPPEFHPDPDLPEDTKRRAGDYRMAKEPDAEWRFGLGQLGLPVELENPISIKPWATWVVASVIALASVASFPDLTNIVARFGLVPDQATRWGGITLLTAFFLHGGITHLLSNLYFLLVFGDNVEEFLRRWRFLLLLLLATLAGQFAHILLASDSSVPAIGASGGVSGIIAFYALQFPEARLGIWVRTWRGYVYRYRGPRRLITFSAFSALVIWGIFQVFGVWKQLQGFSKVSALAHLGGAAVGFIFWLLCRRRAHRG